MSTASLVFEDSLFNILSRFMVNISVIFVLIRMIYYRYTRKDEYLFSYFLMGIIIFFICSILDTVDIQLGMALGLFAVFAILRFRTVTYTVKDMTYMFIVIGLSIINSLANIHPPFISALVINSIIILAVYLLEVFYRKNSMSCIRIIYNKPELIVPEHKEELIKDLSRQTGYNVKKIRILKINIVAGTSEIEIYYKKVRDTDY